MDKKNSAQTHASQRKEIMINQWAYQNPLSAQLYPHAHDLWELLFIIRGNVSCMVEGKRYPLYDHSLILVRPACTHRVHIEGDLPYEYCSLMCDLPNLLPEMAARIPEDVDVVHFRDNEQIAALFWQMNLHYQQAPKESYTAVFITLIRELLQEILAAVEDQGVQKPMLEDPVVNEAVKYIGENIMTLTGIEEICGVLGVSKSRLYNLFIRHMLISPQRYIQVKRLALVQMALRSEDCPPELPRKYGYKDKAAVERAYYRFYRSVP